MRIYVWACCLLISNYAYCSGAITVPERLFTMTNTDVNVSQGDFLYKSQAAGYYTGGGGMVMRSPVKSTQFVNIQIPQMPQAGCGGIDIYTGGLSFVSGEELVETLQAVASNAAGFAFMLGLESISPMMTNTVRQLQSWANTINGIGINSCETAAQLVGSVWPASDMASQHICRTAGSNGIFKDYIESRHQCSSDSKISKKKTNKTDAPLEGEYNIAWEALMVLPFFKNQQNQALAEMYMTLVGTFVVLEQDIQFYYSKAEDNEFLTHLLEGGTVKKYKCSDKEKCLKVYESEENIQLKDSWFSKIRNTLISMQDKIKRDDPLDNSEKGLLNTSRLPLFKIVNVLSAYHRGGTCAVDLDSIADIITWDVLAQIINEAIDTVRRGCAQLRAQSMYGGEIDKYLNDLERVTKVVKRYEEHAQKAIDLEMRLIQKIQLLEKQLNSEIMVH